MGKAMDQWGTDAQGAASPQFCVYCMKGGEFLHRVSSATEMQSLVIERMREKGFPRILGWLFTRGIPNLQRWRVK